MFKNFLIDKGGKQITALRISTNPTRVSLEHIPYKCAFGVHNCKNMSEFGVLDCIIRDSGGVSNPLEDKSGFQGDAIGDWSNGGLDVLSASMHDSGILSSNALGSHTDVSFL